MIEYRLKLPIQNINFDDTDVTFVINYIKSRRPSVFYFIFHCYDSDCQLVDGAYTDEIKVDANREIIDKTTPEYENGYPVYTSSRSVIGTEYTPDGGDYIHDFTIPKNVIDNTSYYRIEIVTLGIDSENPLYFTELMFKEGKGFDEYHTPSELYNDHTVELPVNTYANLYDRDDNYLQVIRPHNEAFNTNNLKSAEYTILAPHFSEEPEVDGHVDVFLECMNQTEQTIDVLR